MDAALEKRLKRQVIGKPHRFLAVVPLGFEQTLVEELKSIGIETIADGAEAPFEPFRIVGDGKVEFTAKIVEAWKAIAYSRIANRVLMHIADFKAENFREFEKKASEIPWELYLQSGTATPGSIAIHVTCKHSRLYHSDAIAERLHKVIGEALGNPAPTVIPAPSHPDAAQDQHSSPERHPDEGQDRLLAPQNLYVNFLDDRCTLWLDLAGEELYKRGHERFVNDAPLKETIAAGMLFEVSALAAAPVTIFDLMAGSGTFSLEAAYKASGLIPGVCRDFALKHQPAFKEATWRFLTEKQSEATSEAPAPIPAYRTVTSDISEQAVEIIKHNVECSPLAQTANGAGSGPAKSIALDPQLHDFFTYTAEEIASACLAGTQPAIVLNPPYGKRLDFDAPKLYTQIGHKLAELSRSLKALGKTLSVAILAPKDDTRNGAKYTCTANLLRECTMLDPAQNPCAKHIVTSHGGLSLNAFIAKF